MLILLEVIGARGLLVAVLEGCITHPAWGLACGDDVLDEEGVSTAGS